jgi:FeS assembly SUF system protein|tara:strand:+ start:8031 stop:8351 length:321 start_codon:yes stop_codon:yes gene_type:complete
MDHLAKKDLEEEIIQVIKTIYDPEIPVDIYELGLIYHIKIDDEVNVHIDMTLTSPNCPAAETLPAEVEQKVKGMELVNNCKIDIVFDPTWERHMMSEEAQIELGMI